MLQIECILILLHDFFIGPNHLGSEINLTRVSAHEFANLIADGVHLIAAVFDGLKHIVIGNADGLMPSWIPSHAKICGSCVYQCH